MIFALGYGNNIPKEVKEIKTITHPFNLTSYVYNSTEKRSHSKSLL